MHSFHDIKHKQLNLFLILFILFILIIRVFSVFKLQIDLDERQHFHIAYRLFMGDTLYKDVWEHHGYLLYYLLKPAFAFLPQSFNAFALLRLCLMPFSLITGWLVYRISRELLSKTSSLLSVLLFLLLDIFYIKSLEIRPDGLQLLFFLLSVWSVLLFLRKKKNRFLVWAGFCLGMSFWLSAKALYLMFSMGLAIPLVLLANKQSVRYIISCLLCTGSGLVLGLLLGGLPMWRDHLLPEVWQYTLLENFRFADQHKTSFIDFRNFAFWIFAYTGLFLMMLRIRRKEGPAPAGWLMLMANLFPLLIILYVLAPAVYLQSGLPVVALLAPFGGFCLYTLFFETKKAWLKYTFLFLLLFYTGVNTGKLAKSLWVDENIKFKQRYSDLEKLCSPEDRILSRNPDYPYIRTALPYSTLVKGIRMQMGQGKYSPEWLEGQLSASECRVVAEWIDIPPSFSKLIRQHYVPHPEIQDTNLFVSGYRHEEILPKGEQIDFELIAAGNYQLDFAGEGKLLLNGKPVMPEDQIYLPAGRHALLATGRVSHLHLYYRKTSPVEF